MALDLGFASGGPKRIQMNAHFLAGISTACILALGFMVLSGNPVDARLSLFLKNAVQTPRFNQVLTGPVIQWEAEKLESRMARAPATVGGLAFDRPSGAPERVAPESVMEWVKTASVSESKNSIFEQFIISPESMRQALLEGLRQPETRLNSIEVLSWWVGSAPDPEKIRWLNSEILGLNLNEGIEAALYEEALGVIQNATFME